MAEQSSNGSHAPSVPEMSVTELSERLQNGSRPVLVDVREGFERHIADLPESGQIHIPMNDFLLRISELDPSEEIVVYCRSGLRSAWATGELIARGYSRVWNLKGGILAWGEEVDPSVPAY